MSSGVVLNMWYIRKIITGVDLNWKRPLYIIKWCIKHVAYEKVNNHRCVELSDYIDCITNVKSAEHAMLRDLNIRSGVSKLFLLMRFKIIRKKGWSRFSSVE